MSAKNGNEQADRKIEFDTGDIDSWVGIPLAGSNMKEPVNVTDIRRFAQALQNPNPLYFDEEYASESRFGQIVAPQSFLPATSDSGGGVAPAIQGYIPGTHVLFAGDEFWFYGPRVFPGDKIRQDRMLFDYKLTDTGFAGPSMFSRGDTTYINQRGEILAKQRATAIRYRADEAVKRAGKVEQAPEPEWTEEALHDLKKQKDEWIISFRELGHNRRLSVVEGEKIQRRVIGPHSDTSMLLEWSACMSMVWGSYKTEACGWDSTEGANWDKDAGWLPELARDHEGAKLDPTRGDPILSGPAKGHQQVKFAELIGMPRGYGLGTTMSTWMVDYISNWAGEWGELVHIKTSLRAPTLTGDAAFLDGEVVAVMEDTIRGLGRPLALVRVVMKDQDGRTIATAKAEVRLPTEELPAPCL